MIGERKEGYKFLWKGEKTDNRRGMGIMKNDDQVQDVMATERIITRLMIAKSVLG